MKNFFIAFLVFLIWSFFGLWLYSWLNPIKQTDRLSEITSIENETTIGLDTLDRVSIDSLTRSEKTQLATEEFITEGLRANNLTGDVVFLFPKGISIFKDTSLVKIPSEILDFKYKVNTYLIEHPKEEVQILSLYAASEKIKNPNLGIRRGAKIKDILESVGIPREKIAIKSMIKEINYDVNNEFPYGISFIFKPLDTLRVNALKFSLPEDKTIYPKLVSNDIVVNKALKDLLEEAKNVLTTNPNVTIEIIGHTDNIGNANDNYLLALRYARQVRWYLISKGGFNKDQVVALSEGESNSIASNSTSEGQLLNRRIEIKYRAN